MTETTADFMLNRLSDWGVRRIYGYPGDGINGILTALDRAMDRFEFVQVRHEQSVSPSRVRPMSLPASTTHPPTCWTCRRRC